MNRSKKIYFCRNYIEFMKGMKNFVLLIVSFFISLSLYAQTQYDYYDDSAVAGGVDRALHGILIIGGIVIVVVVLALLLGGAAKIYFWFNPQEDPKNIREMAAKKMEPERVTEQTAQDDSHSDVSKKQSVKEDIGKKQEIYKQKAPVQQKEKQIQDKKNIEKDGFTLSPNGVKLIKGNDDVECYIPYGVKVVCNRAFKDSHQIRTLYIPETVEVVEEYAFSCESIETVHIPQSILKWGESAFLGCYNLSEVSFDPEICTLGYSMFNFCESIEHMVIPPKIKNIPSYSFQGCKSLCSVTFPVTVEQIGDGTFLGCEKLENIELPNSINRIGNGAFQDCYGLKSITLPASLDGLRDNLFMNCFCIEELIIPEGVIAIGENCFYNCCELKTIQLPASLLYIEKAAFYDCSGVI
ncbi:MAG: leucine-rich repeat domain-containing protein [Lachnospiraceae bacterium]|nr:leucine-rich repeat domain-containing protein [Lachnospiraceae bacterium]